jgi:hypothetical protein
MNKFPVLKWPNVQRLTFTKKHIYSFTFAHIKNLG